MKILEKPSTKFLKSSFHLAQRAAKRLRIRLRRTSHPESQLRSQNINVSRPRPPIVLPHDVEIQCEMFIEGVIRADREPVSHPVVKTPVIENFVRHISGELCFIKREGMF